MPAEICLPAAGQGAIGIESRTHDDEIVRALQNVNHDATRFAVEAERAVLAGLEGGCQVPIGVWARIESGELVIDACVCAADGSELLRAKRAGTVQAREDLAREITAELLSRGAERLLRVAARSTGSK